VRNSHPTLYLTLELPWPLTRGDLDHWKSQPLWGTNDPPVLGFEPVVLAGETTVRGAVTEWRPTSETREWLRRGLFPALKGRAERVLVRLTMKGNFIRMERTFLDGEPFGPRTSVNFEPTSGDNRPAGDFELWFWLVPKAR
jgi:hypothetical protein